MKSSRKADLEHTGPKPGKPDGVQGDAAPVPPESADQAAVPGADAPPAVATAAAPPPADDRLLRLQADFDNYRKRVLREKEDLYRRANEDIMEELLPVMDHLELALAAASGIERQDSVVKGFKLVGEQLMSVLGKFGLTPIAVEGVPFDPNLHEAILHMPSAEVPENGIISRTRAGYMLGGRLLRAAQVVVSSGAPSSGDDAPASDFVGE